MMVSVSIGYAFYPDDGTDPQQLREIADQRMYEDKKRYYEEHPDRIYRQ